MEVFVIVGEYEEFSFSLGGLLCETAVALCSPEERNQLGMKPAHKQDRLTDRGWGASRCPGQTIPDVPATAGLFSCIQSPFFSCCRSVALGFLL